MLFCWLWTGFGWLAYSCATCASKNKNLFKVIKIMILILQKTFSHWVRKNFQCENFKPETPAKNFISSHQSENVQIFTVWMNMDSSDSEDELFSMFLFLKSRTRRRSLKKKREWIRSIFKKRKEQGHYHNLVQEMRLMDRECHFRCHLSFFSRSQQTR